MKTKHLKNTVNQLATLLKKERVFTTLRINGKSIIARSGDISVKCDIPNGEHGETVLIDAVILKNLLATIKADEVELKTDAECLRIITKEQEYKLPTNDTQAAFLPNIKGQPLANYFIGEADMETIVQAASLYAVKDDIRLQMECIEIGQHIVATDSHKLLYRKSNIEFPVDPICEAPTKLYLQRDILPLLKYATVGILCNYQNEADMTAQFDVTCLNALNMVIYQNLPIGGFKKYPNWSAVIPYDNPNVYEFSKQELLDAVNTVSYVTKKTERFILSLNGKCVLNAEDLDYGLKHEMELNGYAKKEAVDDLLTIGLNPKRLINILDSISGDKVTFACSIPNRPIVINEEALLMPIFL